MKIPVPQYAPLLRTTAIEVIYIYETMTLKHYTAFNFGAVIPILGVKIPGFTFETGVSGSIFSRFELFSESFNFVTADFMGGGYAAVESGSFIIDISVYHISSHAGDDYVLYDNGSIVNTGYEAARLIAAWNTSEWFSCSLGTEYRFHRSPERTVFYISSFMAEGRLDFLHFGIPIFLECDIELVDWYRYVNVGARIGVYTRYLFNSVILGRQDQGRQCHEFSITYYYGFSKALYFERTRESLVLMGPTYRY